jgi:hypothetical protein
MGLSSREKIYTIFEKTADLTFVLKKAELAVFYEMPIKSNQITWPQIPEDSIRCNYFICTEVSRRIPDKILPNSLRNLLTYSH